MQFDFGAPKAPLWMDKIFFEKVLRSSENDKHLKVTDLVITPGSKPGDHLASFMFRVIVTYESRGKTVGSLPLIVKTMPEMGPQKDMLQDTPIFDTEIKMYTKTLPEMQRLLWEIGDCEELAPRLIYQNLEKPVIILEDLTQRGYEMILPSLDFCGTKMVIKKLAKFHALSFHMEQDKQDVKNYNVGFLHEQIIQKMDFFLDNVGAFIDEVKTWAGYEKEVEKLEKLKPDFFNKLFAKKDDGGYKVLNHGDFSIRNLMFRKKDVDIESIIMLDFQLSNWGSPAHDLIFVLFAIASQDTREWFRNELIQAYFVEFIAILKKLGCLKQPPTFLDLQIELLKHGFFEVLMTACFLPMSYIDFSNFNMADLFDPEKIKDFRKATYAHPEYKKTVQKMLPTFMTKGFLEK